MEEQKEPLSLVQYQIAELYNPGTILPGNLHFVKYKLIKLEFIHCLQQNILTDTLIM